ncbi:penicillin-binding protein activator [Tsuneonella flava]|uniref:Penicillin-binding protein activator n=1 Tax=Tsuneonella flava TaxID=2055955 RepID=A0ABX7K981_9SPHN|nr:penicillin-binding protein activator [Tsuneonella flava]QSB44082.1 penicillin-binding protein activator [Tsuneonella flava]
MNGWKMNRRKLMVAGSALLLAGCKVIPGGGPNTTGPTPTPTPEPSATTLPTDDARHRVALLVPTTGTNGDVGLSIANATTMALLDTNASNLRITTYDTGTDARSAAAKAIADGNSVILGPLMADNVPQVLVEARRANVPLISFSNDSAVAGPDVFVMGIAPGQSIERSVKYARSREATRFAAIIPDGDYGQRAAAALSSAVAGSGGTMVASETYARGNTSIVSAATRLQSRGGFDTVLIADGPRLAAQAAGVLRPRGTGTTQLLGTELWSGDSSVTRAVALRGAMFSAVSDSRFKRFSDSYNTRFGKQPYRISTLGYDAVLLTLRVARDWKPGRKFPISTLRSPDGFLGLDGVFRFNRNNVAERAMEVRQVQDGKVVIISPAPGKFGG